MAYDQEVLVRTRQEFQEDGRIDGQVAADSNTPERIKDTDGGKGGRSRGGETEDSGDTEGTVESPFSTDNVAAESPEEGT